jgi:hypothetical protein
MDKNQQKNKNNKQKKPKQKRPKAVQKVTPMVAKDLLPAVQNIARNQHLTNAVSNLIGSIACPAEVPAQRLPLDTPVPTSLMCVHSLTTNDTKGTPVANESAATYWVFKQLARSYLYKTGTLSTGDSTYEGVLGPVQVTVPSGSYNKYTFRWSTTPNGATFVSTGVINQNWKVQGFTPGPTNVNPFHGPFLPLGVDTRKDKYVLANKGFIRVWVDPVLFTASLSGFPATTLFGTQAYRIGLQLSQFSVPGEPRSVVGDVVLFGSTTAVNYVDIQIPFPAYYTVDIIDVTASSNAGPSAPNSQAYIGLRFELISDIAYPLVCNVMAPEVYEDPEICDKHRVVASSLLLSNTTAVLNKEGVITGVTVTPDTWPFNLTSDSIGRFVGATSHPFEKGMYLFQKPERDQLEFIKGALDEWTDNPVTGVIAPKVPFFDMDSLLSYDVVIIDDPDTTSPSVWRVRRDLHWEFRTTSQRYLREMPLLDEEVFSNVMRVLAVLPNHVDNPIHWAKIGRAINRAVNWTWNNRGKVLNVGHILSDAFLPGAVAGLVDRGLDKARYVTDSLEHAIR